METKQLRRDVEVLILDHIGNKLREKCFDPKGRRSYSILDQLAHYDLSVSVALWWLDRKQGADLLNRSIISTCTSPRLEEREAVILSSFAGLLISSLPVQDILTLYQSKPSSSFSENTSKGSIVVPFSLSHHPLAMLGSYQAVHHSRKIRQRLKRQQCERSEASPGPASSSSSSSSQTFISSEEESSDALQRSDEAVKD